MKIVVLKDREFLDNLKDEKLKEIAVTDKEVDIYDELVIDGKHYIPVQVLHSNEIMGVREFVPLSGCEKKYEMYLTCPYCGYKDVDAFELLDDNGLEECARCGAEFEYEREIEITYSTKLIKNPKRVEI